MFRSTMKLLFTASPLLIAYSAAHPSQRQHEYTTDGPVVSSQHDGIVALQASPQCWADALLTVDAFSQDAPPSSLGTIVCAAMSHDHKKGLALELARCQMEEAGRPLFEPHATTDCSRPMKSTTILSTCLSRMTDAGLQVYMHCFSHVHQSCTRLTQERIVQASQVATEQLHTVLAHQFEMWVHQDEREREREEREREREERERERERERDEVEMEREEREREREEGERKREEREREREREREDREREREERQREREELEREREERQRVLERGREVREREREERERERKDRDEKLRQEQEQKMLQLTKTVEATAEKMKPFLGIESLIAMTTDGITWLTSLIHFLSVMNGVWLLTLSKRHDATRRFMFRMACAGAFLEFIMHWMVSQGVLADVDRVRGTSTLRKCTLAFEGSAYIVGLILSLFQTRNKDEINLNEAMLQHLEMMQMLNANAEKARQEALLERDRQRVVVETPVPSPLVVNGHSLSVGNCAEAASPSLVSLPPSTILDKEQSHALAYLEVLRILSAHTPPPYVMSPQEAFSAPPLRLCEQQIGVYDQSNDNSSNDNPPVENLRKRLNEVNDDNECDAEPKRKRLKKLKLST